MNNQVFHFMRRNICLSWIALLGLMGCSSPYSETAYEMATTTKANTMTLMAKATEPYSRHQDKAAELLQEARVAYEYNLQRPNNEESTRQWAIMLDPDENMLAGLISKWKKDGTLKPFFLKEATDEIGDGFDTISGLESGKTKPKSE